MSEKGELLRKNDYKQLHQAHTAINYCCQSYVGQTKGHEAYYATTEKDAFEGGRQVLGITDCKGFQIPFVGQLVQSRKPPYHASHHNSWLRFRKRSLP